VPNLAPIDVLCFLLSSHHVSTVRQLSSRSRVRANGFIQVRFRVNDSQGLRDRSALLGTTYGFTPPASGRSSPSSAASSLRYADDLEGQNDEQLEGLTAKVKLLKDVCFISLACSRSILLTSS
jgi:hypothetical protein